MPHSVSETMITAKPDPIDKPCLETEDKSKYSWLRAKDGSQSMSRPLANLERMFVMFNKDLHGQNCPFMGASISVVRPGSYSSGLKPFNISQLHARALTAFCQTRWKYPTLAARIVDDNEALYKIESKDSVEKWADRTVFTVCQEGGWLALRERLSRESALPTTDGDCCLFYLIVRPTATTRPELQRFDVLMHTHHALIDGSGIRVVFNEFLQRLTDPLPSEDIEWGEETKRLLPAAIALEKVDDAPASLNGTAGPQAPEERLKGFHRPDVGLPVYRPDLLGPKPEQRGTLLVAHTFEDPEFLPRLLTTGRKHGVKLTGILHAAMLKAVYGCSENKPSDDDVYNSGSPMDLRNGYLLPEYCDRNRYVNSAVAIQPMKVPCKLFHPETGAEGEDGLWKAAACISDQWEAIKQKKGLAQKTESDAKALMESIANARRNPSKVPTKPRTCPTFSSDPPGSQGFRGTYTISGFDGELSLVLNSYQLATDQIQAVVSARSHSWNGLLTLCLVFNAMRNPKEKMEQFLGRWTEILLDVGRDVDVSNGVS